MANFTVKEMATGSLTPIEDVELDLTNKELIEQLIDGGALPPIAGGEGKSYMILENGKIVDETKSLGDMGFNDGDTIEVIKKATGAF